MKAKRRVLIVMGAVLALFSVPPQSAFAFGKHGFNSPSKHFRVKKNMGPYGGNYLAPKKQKRVKDRYRSPVTGNVLFGKPKK